MHDSSPLGGKARFGADLRQFFFPPSPPQSDCMKQFCIGNYITDKISQGELPPSYSIENNREFLLLSSGEVNLFTSILYKTAGAVGDGKGNFSMEPH